MPSSIIAEGSTYVFKNLLATSNLQAPEEWHEVNSVLRIDLCTSLLSSTLLSACGLNHIFLCILGAAIIMLKILGAIIKNLASCVPRICVPLAQLTAACFHVIFNCVLLIVPFLCSC
jgi:energy-converting hydrogenase Eha subunit A